MSQTGTARTKCAGRRNARATSPCFPSARKSNFDKARAAAVERRAQELQARPTEKVAAAPAKVHKHAQRSHHSKKH